jgi:predicted glycoside hydrolase/deacetylase ChbG (UPF0249 family)
MRVILSADDFGLNSFINRETIAALERGTILGASIMANMPEVNEALRYARRQANFSFGVHLCFVEGQALSGLLPTLTDSRGSFNGTRSQRLRAIFQQLSVDEIATEMRAQISKILDNGVQVDYVDSHGHMHKLKPFRDALNRVLPSFWTEIKRVRNSQTIYLDPKYMNPSYLARRHFSKELRKLFVTTDEFYMPTSAGDRSWAERLAARLDSSSRSIEVGIHPGMIGDNGAEEQEAQYFMKIIVDVGHTAVSWRDL